LADNPDLKYAYLLEFEKAMVARIKKHRVQQSRDAQLGLDNEKKTLVYKKGGLVFAYNFHPVDSYDGLFLPMPEKGEYDVVMSTDDYCYGGHGRIWHQRYSTVEKDGKTGILLYLPSRTAVVLKKK
jgi:1,4-alpha-glucan branching enzyme